MQPTQILKNEHRVIEQVLASVQGQRRRRLKPWRKMAKQRNAIQRQRSRKRAGREKCNEC